MLSLILAELIIPYSFLNQIFMDISWALLPNNDHGILPVEILVALGMPNDVTSYQVPMND